MAKQVEMTSYSDPSYIPALGAHWLTPLYDPLQRWVMRDEQFKRRLIVQANVQPAQHVLDLGCGTGTLTIQVKRAQPLARVTGLDPDPEVLAMAHAKSVKAGAAINVVQGLADALPYPSNVFDRVLSSLVLHHLTRDQKQSALDEFVRVLKSAGQLHVADFGKPHNVYGRILGSVMQRFETVSDNVRGRLPQLFYGAGLKHVEETARITTLFGTLSLYRAQKP